MVPQTGINKQLLNIMLAMFSVLAVAGTILIYYFKLYPLFIPSYYLILSQIFLGSFIIINNPKSQVNVFFFHFLLFMALWNTFASIIIHLPPSTPLFWCDWFIYIAAILMTFFLMLFTMVFPQKKPYFTRFNRNLLLIMPLFIIVVILVNPNFVIKGIILENGMRAPASGDGYGLFVFYIVFYIGIVLYNLLQSYLLASSLEKLRLFYFLVGAFISVLGFVITNLILLWMGIVSLAWMGSWFTLIFVAFTTYSITKHNLLDISIVISRFFAELLTIALYVSIYLGLVWMFKSTSRETVNWLFILMTIAMGILVGQTHQTIRLFIQTTSDKLFLRGKYNYYKELSDATTRVGEKMSLAEILKVLYSTFNNVIEISNPRIFLPEYFSDNEKSSKAYVIYDKASFQPLMSDLSVLLDAKWLKTLIDNRVPMYEVKEIDAFLVVPCFVEERLIGFFALGRKLSEDAYTDEDLRLLRALANQAGMALDHTRSYEKIRADLELVERQLERSQRLASLGTLTAGVTHEIRNPLTVIRGETERLLNQPRDTEYLANFRDLLLKHIDRISGIVNRMLDLAKEKPKQKIAVDLNELINSTLPLLSLGPIKVTTELTASQSINGDPEALQEVIINLLQNAIDSMPHGGQLSIKTYQENNRTVVEINDTGKGIPLEIREKIFDPFFSSRHEGVGLGLSIAYRIVREHDGDISVTSEVGKGSTFKLEF